mmetsp:Transcript_9457/g.20941  ORF Transcript_9457/g.20941 Transcript_9457/m.20941 type:complete len:560 (-) Transcript_9457:161-1840(-)|eukprot:CAMPEP_0170592962 /NCGR_PEP_ID=MMETSP0224-20130122/13195_1 /TAXON_ID=285029 /ORGANISM="Togula jolla, Strain CCCM 725" /LENGTH=559 /DNA_ID=CAMNT_0010916885 /DNA_START=107 /DNA_END=1786 /DNA_ORIENTATION=+
MAAQAQDWRDVQTGIVVRNTFINVCPVEEESQSDNSGGSPRRRNASAPPSPTRNRSCWDELPDVKLGDEEEQEEQDEGSAHWIPQGGYGAGGLTEGHKDDWLAHDGEEPSEALWSNRSPTSPWKVPGRSLRWNTESPWQERAKPRIQVPDRPLRWNLEAPPKNRRAAAAAASREAADSSEAMLGGGEGRRVNEGVFGRDDGGGLTAMRAGCSGGFDEGGSGLYQDMGQSNGLGSGLTQGFGAGMGFGLSAPQGAIPGGFGPGTGPCPGLGGFGSCFAQPMAMPNPQDVADRPRGRPMATADGNSYRGFESAMAYTTPWAPGSSSATGPPGAWTSGGVASAAAAQPKMQRGAGRGKGNGRGAGEDHEPQQGRGRGGREPDKPWISAAARDLMAQQQGDEDSDSGDQQHGDGGKARAAGNGPLGGGGPKRTDYQKKYRPAVTTAITTLMLKNIPCRKSQEQVMMHIDGQGFHDRYDFFYLPRDVKFHANLGYAFINFTDPEDAARFMEQMNGYRFSGSGSNKACAVVPAHVQGLMNNLAAFKRTEVMRSSRKPYFSGLLRL